MNGAEIKLFNRLNMNCQNCKNPVQKESIICEWCGSSILNETSKVEISSINMFDDELFTLIKAQKIQEASFLHSKYTNNNLRVSDRYIDELAISRGIPLLELEKLKSDNQRKNNKMLFLGLSWLITGIGIVFVLIAFNRIELIKNYESNDLYFSAILIPVGMIGLFVFKK